jgi:hypothetical protein
MHDRGAASSRVQRLALRWRVRLADLDNDLFARGNGRAHRHACRPDGFTTAKSRRVGFSLT